MVAVFATLLLFVTALAPGVASAQSASDEASFVSLINQVRAQNGLDPLEVDPELRTLARNWTSAQANGTCGVDENGEINHICHASPISAGVTSDWRKLGENVGTGPSVSAVMDAFIASPSHYDNIVDPAFTHIGIGVVWDGNRLYTTHRFMRLDPPASATTTTAAPATTAAPPTTPAPTTQAPTTAAPATTSAQTSNTNQTASDPADVDEASPEEVDDEESPQTTDLEPAESQPPSDQQGQVNVDLTRASVLVSALGLGS